MKAGLPGVARSTLLVMAATFGSMLLGFAREIVNARFFGTRWELDTFLAAATIPTILFGLFNGALVSALLPVFSAYLARGEEEAAWALGNTLFHLLAIALTLCAVLGWIFAPWYVPVIAHGFPPPQMSVAIRMTQWLMPSIVATSLAGILNAMLNAYHRFTAASFQGLAINLVTIVVTIALLDRFGIFALVFGTALGLLAALLVQLPSYLLLGHYRCVIDWRHPGLRKIGMMLGPIVIGSAAGQLALLFDRFFASTLAPGYISGMNYAGKLVGFPQQLFATAVATVIFPLLADQFSNDDVAGVRRSVMTGIRVVNFVTIPAVFALASLAIPLVSTLFQRGAFTSQASLLSASLLPFAAISLVPIAANMVLTRCCYACHESRRPVAASVAAVAINILLSILWLPTLGAKGLLLANGVSQWVQTAWLLILVRRLGAGLEWRRLLESAARVTAASAIMAATVTAARASLGPPADDFPARLLNLSLLLVTAALAFLLSAKLLHLDEVRVLWTLLKNKVGGPTLAAPAESAEVPIG